ncbi:unnamed protein product [Paramecium octaurelia]|uniref:Uncharacterized protein n=1 Tax=Paramecium octaurelia TaxID=43137 RepID=A0A8S1YGE3_PAROT|nr:unnamed protein product [Paramecium octaurelia]
MQQKLTDLSSIFQRLMRDLRFLVKKYKPKEQFEDYPKPKELIRQNLSW